MPAPSASWSVKRIHATYRNRLSLAKEPGTWTAVASGRIVNTLADGTKQISGPARSATQPSTPPKAYRPSSSTYPLRMIRTTSRRVGEITLTITFSSGGTEVYHFSPLLSWPADPGTDLATLADPALSPPLPPTPSSAYQVASLSSTPTATSSTRTERSHIGGGGPDAEVVRDTIAAALVAGSNVTVTPNDAGNTITLGRHRP